MEGFPQVFFLPPAIQQTPPGEFNDAFPWDQSDIEARARALSCSPQLAQIRSARVVLRRGINPQVGIIGNFSRSEASWLESSIQILEDSYNRLRYVSYDDTEQASALLASALTSEFSRSDLAAFQFYGIPRGGLIVLGMLSYVLNIDPAQIVSHEAVDPNVPLVVVDDCALTGTRFKQILEKCLGQSIVFAVLYSHPDLRRAITDREDRVTKCLGAHDLHDHAPTVHGEKYTDWKDRWHQRFGETGYWVGLPDHVCFAWSEPDISIWNETRRDSEPGFRLVPPEYCLKNRSAVVAIEYQDDGVGPLRPSPSVLYSDIGEKIIVGDSNTELCYEFSDVSADIWRSMITNGESKKIFKDLSGKYDADPSTLAADLEEFIADLLNAGVLVRDE